MTNLKIKLTVAGVVLVGAISYLAYAGMQKGWVYTLGVDQYLAKPEQKGQRIRLCGTVAEEGVEVRKAQMSARFFIKGEKEQIAVAYKGVVPDMFKAGAEVVVEGKQNAAGVFESDTLMTKCASKYEDMPKAHPPVADQKASATGGQP